jgi:hypothetical protein
MLNFIYAKCFKLAFYAQCQYAECCYAQCRYAECRGASESDANRKDTSLLQTLSIYRKLRVRNVL